MTRSIAQLSDSLQTLNLSAAHRLVIKTWYGNLVPGELVYPKNFARQLSLGVSKAQETLLFLALKNFLTPVTVPIWNDVYLEEYAVKGFELKITKALIEGAENEGINPKFLKARTAYRK